MAHDLPDAPVPSMTSLLGGIVNDVQTLMKQELALAKREVAEELNKAKRLPSPWVSALVLPPSAVCS
jgi:hypothetical protein